MAFRQNETIGTPATSTGWPHADRHAGSHSERLSDLIGDIYDCVIDPANWEPVLEAICRDFSFSNAVLGVIPLHAGGHIINVSVGFDAAWLAIRDDDRYRAASVELWGGPERAQNLPLDEPVLGSHSPGYAARHTNPYFRDILAPRGFFDAALITIARDPSFLGYVAFNRHVSAGAITEADVARLRLLAPHFRRVVTISNLFDLKALEAASLGAALENVAFGVLLVDETLRIVHANAAARSMLELRDPIRSNGGAVALAEEIAHAALERAVRQAATDKIGLGPRGIGIPARGERGGPCVIHVLPLQQGAIRRGLAQRAAAALFIAPGTANAHVPAEAMALLYDLTPAETRILEMLCAGMTQSAIGDALGIARTTVKTHLLHLFSKTGCKRQADLLRLAAGLSLPI